MNTNTIEQAVELKELGIREDYCSEGCSSGYEWWVKTPGLGPVFTLDDLHRVFIYLGIWQFPSSENGVSYWSTYPSYLQKYLKEDFPVTENTAEDWTTILIWLLKEGHVTAEQVNKALGE